MMRKIDWQHLHIQAQCEMRQLRPRDCLPLISDSGGPQRRAEGPPCGQKLKRTDTTLDLSQKAKRAGEEREEKQSKNRELCCTQVHDHHAHFPARNHQIPILIQRFRFGHKHFPRGPPKIHIYTASDSPFLFFSFLSSSLCLLAQIKCSICSFQFNL